MCVCGQIIVMLELDDVADTLVGASDGGLPVGEKKRYTIGVELVTNPSVLFLGALCVHVYVSVCVCMCVTLALHCSDEPTSGLDSRSAAVVMRVIKRVALSGRTVIATIHVSIPVFPLSTGTLSCSSMHEIALCLQQPSADIFFGFDQ